MLVLQKQKRKKTYLQVTKLNLYLFFSSYYFCQSNIDHVAILIVMMKWTVHFYCWMVALTVMAFWAMYGSMVQTCLIGGTIT